MSPRPGPRREPIHVRVSEAGRGEIEKRAAAEVGGDRPLSEMARRLLAYAVTRMPVGWTPETDRRTK